MSKGKTQKHYDRNPASKAKKEAYNREYQKKPSAVKKRVEANRANRKAGTYGNGDGRDYDHRTKRMVKASVNRGAAEKSRLKGSKRS
jgi:hypothetical protein